MKRLDIALDEKPKQGERVGGEDDGKESIPQPET